MKRCPTCGNTYTNDRLIFCLEDGATLARVSDAQSGYDPEATLHIPAEENVLPPTQASKPQGAQTFRQSPPALTVPPRAERPTSDNQSSAASASTSKSTSPVLVAGITAIVILLLVIAGLGIALLVRNSSRGGDVPAENNNRARNREPNSNASNTVNDNGKDSSDDSSNKAGTNANNRNGSTATDPAARAEAKVVRGALLEESDLAALAREELRRLRNAVYARHGRTFDSAELQRYFDSRTWYNPRSDYTEAALTATDRANIKLIQTIENSR